MPKTTFSYEAPTPYPEDGGDYVWNENQKNWEQVVVDEWGRIET